MTTGRQPTREEAVRAGMANLVIDMSRAALSQTVVDQAVKIDALTAENERLRRIEQVAQAFVENRRMWEDAMQDRNPDVLDYLDEQYPVLLEAIEAALDAAATTDAEGE